MSKGRKHDKKTATLSCFRPFVFSLPKRARTTLHKTISSLKIPFGKSVARDRTSVQRSVSYVLQWRNWWWYYFSKRERERGREGGRREKSEWRNTNFFKFFFPEYESRSQWFSWSWRIWGKLAYIVLKALDEIRFQLGFFLRNIPELSEFARFVYMFESEDRST